MIVLAMLTGFNKIGSLERGRPRAKQFCVFAYVSECVCVCCAPERDRARMCVSVQRSAVFVMYTMHHIQCSVCVQSVMEETVQTVQKMYNQQEI